MNVSLSAGIEIINRVRQGCVVSPWLFNVYMDGVVREIKANKCTEVGVCFQMRENWNFVDKLFVDDTVLFGEVE